MVIEIILIILGILTSVLGIYNIIVGSYIWGLLFLIGGIWSIGLSSVYIMQLRRLKKPGTKVVKSPQVETQNSKAAEESLFEQNLFETKEIDEEPELEPIQEIVEVNDDFNGQKSSETIDLSTFDFERKNNDLNGKEQEVSTEETQILEDPSQLRSNSKED